MDRIFCLAILSVLYGCALGNTAEPTSPKKPIKALLITGGCCHDYDRQKLILTKGISARADVHWTVVQQGGNSTNAKIPVYENTNWADGFDVVVHNECFAHVKDAEWVEQILKPHREGTPTVLIHCAMHCYRTGDDRWFEFVGLQSPGHGPHYAYTVENLQADHPIMAGFGQRWTVPNGELYHSLRVFDSATPLAQAARRPDGKPQICVWTNQYGKSRVFATTIGHYNETMAEPKYLDMVTRGLLWVTNRLDNSEIRGTDDETDQQIKALVQATVAGKAPAKRPARCCGEGNLAFGRSTKASSEETSKNNFARNAVDGDLRTRWCASGPRAGETWQVDLGEPQQVKSLRIHWEKAGVAYRYRVDASADGKTWGAIVDQSENKKVQQVTSHKVNSPDTRYLRMTFLGSSTGVWGSIWEFEAYAGDLPELPKGATAGGSAAAVTISDVKAPDGFNVTLFGAPPTVNYPACLTAAPTGEVFVGVDEQGSLGKQKGRGKVLRCIDVDGDGVADRINEFARMDHPRGLIYETGSLWVLHPPQLSVFHDDDLDGEADRSETLVTGISTEQVYQRGADHTTNGIRMGIDGWIYIAVGDFGFTEAKGTDGTTLGRRGGGIVRVRPDGTEMEIYCWGLRNILDVSIDPFMNIFTRDNTNDGGGWDIRVSHILQTANYGYPSLFKNFSDEIMPPLADYGGGSGCGTMYLNDTRWPAPYGDAFYSCDWGRSEVYRHNLVKNGPTFDPHQEVFLKIPRPTDIDVDGSGRMYVSSWKNGKFNYGGPNVGFVAQITPQNYLPSPFPDLGQVDTKQLVGFLSSPSAVYRLYSQREILRRGRSADVSQQLVDVIRQADRPLAARVAAIFTLAQLDGADAIDSLVELSRVDDVREFTLRALTDRKPLLSKVSTEPFVAALDDVNPRVRAQALISLGRLGDVQAAEKILPLTLRPKDQPAPTKTPYWNQPDPGRVLQHLAIRALVNLNAVDACLKALDGSYAAGALRALKYMHDEHAVKGLAYRLSTTFDRELRREILTTLIRLYYREGEYKSGWWGTRPDTSGPYFDRQTWAGSETIANVIRTAVAEADKETAQHIKTQLARHKVSISGLPKDLLATQSSDKPQVAVKLPEIDKTDKNLIGNMPYEAARQQALAVAGNAAAGQALFQSQQCNACHTYANGQQPKGPHLVDIGKRYKRSELIESILKPSAKIAQGFDTYGFITVEGKVLTGFVVSESADAVEIRQITGLGTKLPIDDIDARRKQEQSMMPVGIANNLTPKQLADLLAYLESLK